MAGGKPLVSSGLCPQNVCGLRKSLKPVWPHFLIYKIKECEHMPRGYNTVGDKICLEARGTRDLAWITSSSQVSPGKIGHLRSTGQKIR